MVSRFWGFRVVSEYHPWMVKLSVMQEIADVVRMSEERRLCRLLPICTFFVFFVCIIINLCRRTLYPKAASSCTLNSRILIIRTPK